MKINWITIKVRDLEESKEFYGNYLGLAKAREFSPGPGVSIVFFSAENGMEIELISNENEPPKCQPDNIVSIGIAYPNFDELLKEAKEKGILKSGPVIMGKDMECFFAEDPNGVSLQIIRA